MNIEVKNFEFTSKMKQICFILMALGVVGTAGSFYFDKTIGWIDYLVNNLYFITIAVSAIFFIGVQGLTSASWVSPFRRIIEAFGSYLPYAIIFMIPVCFGIHSLYEWSHMEIVNNDPILIQKKPWLNEKFFIFRMFLYLVIWALIIRSQKKLSKEQDETHDSYLFRIARNSSVQMILFGFSICFAAFDWIMSVEPHWFSTIFGVYVFAGSFVSGICFLILASIKLREWGYLEKYITDDHLHDLGKWLFGMSTFWAYIWLSQYLLIWYSNIPEETEYFVLRHDHHNIMFWSILVLHWVVPFFGLMARQWKRQATRLKIIASIVLFAHFLDLYLMVAPKPMHHAHAHITGFGIFELLSWCGFAGIFLFIVGKFLSSNKLLNTGDPNLEEGLHLHQ